MFVGVLVAVGFGVAGLVGVLVAVGFLVGVFVGSGFRPSFLAAAVNSAIFARSSMYSKCMASLLFL